MNCAWALLIGAPLVSPMLWASPAVAADTVETFDPGLSNVELYAGFAGMGRSRAEQVASAGTCAGFGVTPGLSLYLAPSFAADGYLVGARAELALGGFGTPVDTSHFDVDVGLGVAHGGGALAGSHWFELNLDLEPDLALAGVYLRGGLDVCGEEDEDGRSTTRLGANTTIGAYVTIAERHQVLVELDGSWDSSDDTVGLPLQPGEAHVGYNFELLSNLELVHDIGVDIPRGDDQASYSLCLGLIATTPSP